MIIGIIGGGASGMAAALAAAENPNVQVLLFERQARLGRKLQATGNGRCNLTNLHAGQGGYHGENTGFAEQAIHAFDPAMTRHWFQLLGLFTVAEESGRVYPYSDQANSVVDVLRFALDKPNIQPPHLGVGNLQQPGRLIGQLMYAVLRGQRNLSNSNHSVSFPALRPAIRPELQAHCRL